MIPTSRTSRIVSNIQGKETHQLFGGPVYYKDKSGNYKDVDMSHADASSAIGNITLREKHSSSVGIRKDGSKTKYLGIRPDETQEDGTNQMEWSIVNVEFDGVSQDIDLSKNDVSGNKVDLGDVIVHNTKTFTRQLVKYNGTATNFKIEFDIHLKNMAVKNNKYDGSYEFRKPCSLAITDIGEDTGQNIWENHILNPLEATDAKKINLIIGKITDNYIMTSPLDKSEEFSDISLSGYTTTDMANINSSMYMADTICMCFQNQNLSLEFYEFIRDRLCKLWNCTFTEDAYFTDSNEKKFGSCIQDSLGRVFLFINTKEIPDSVKDLFLRKTFENTGYMDTTIDALKTSLRSVFNYSHSSVSVDSSYYKPDSNGSFKIDSGTGEEYRIPYPVILDLDFIPINIGTYHTLKNNGDGIYRYTKYLTQESIMQKLLLECAYIDSTTNITVSTDAHLANREGLSNYSFETLWNLSQVQQDASVFTINAIDQSLFLYGWIPNGGARTHAFSQAGQYGSPTTRRIDVGHDLFWFDTSSISTTVTSSKFNLAASWKAADTTLGWTSEEVIILKGRDKAGNGSITASEYLALDGIADDAAYDKSSVTEYVDAVFNYEDYWANDAFDPTYSDVAYQEIALNSDARTDTENDDMVHLVFVSERVYEDQYDYGGAPSPGSFHGSNRILWEGYNYDGDTATGYHSCTSGEHPPFLEVVAEEGEEEGVTYNATFFGANF